MDSKIQNSSNGLNTALDLKTSHAKHGLNLTLDFENPVKVKNVTPPQNLDGQLDLKKNNLTSELLLNEIMSQVETILDETFLGKYSNNNKTLKHQFSTAWDRSR